MSASVERLAIADTLRQLRLWRRGFLGAGDGNGARMIDLVTREIRRNLRLRRWEARGGLTFRARVIVRRAADRRKAAI